MSRRFQCGNEADDLTFWNSNAANGSWSIGTAAAAARTGSYGLRASTPASPSGTGAYVEHTTTGTMWRTAGHAGGSLLAAGPGYLPGCEVRFYYRTDMSVAANNWMKICQIADAGSFVIVVSVIRNGGDRNVVFTVGTTTKTFITNLAANTRFRFRIKCWTDQNGDGYASIWVYDESDYTLQGHCSIARTWTGTVTRVRFGAVPFVFQNGAQNHDFDDIAINDEIVTVTGDGIHVADPGGGAVLQIDRPMTPAGAFSDFTPVGSANHWENVDEAVANDNTDYNHSSLGAALDQDSYTLANYTGGDVVKSVAVLYKHRSHQAAGTNDIFHTAGLYDGANRLHAAMTAVGATYFWGGTIVDEISGGGATSNAWYNACEPSVKKTINFASANAKRITYMSVEAEDNDGLATAAAPTKQRRKGSVV